MSLTNPNKTVTEQRLNEYHQTILPYLGGMPEILANKFSKGDLYSTDERMIGRWVDGKPLYQKTISLPTARTIATGAWYDIYTNSEVTAISKLVSAFIQTPDGYIFEGQNYRANGADLQMFSSMSLTIPVNSYVTIQYTKTADSPVEIGVDTDYSTTEKIVGTWIDGKPLYQCTWTNLDVQPIMGTWVNIVPCADGESLINCSYGLCENGHPMMLSSDAEIALDLGYFRIKYTQNNSIRKVNFFTAQYTKTTD